MSKQRKNQDTIDDILKEVENKKMDQIDLEDLEQYTKDYDKFNTTALIDDILGQADEDHFGNIEHEKLTQQEQKEVELLLQDVLSGNINQQLQQMQDDSENLQHNQETTEKHTTATGSKRQNKKHKKKPIFSKRSSKSTHQMEPLSYTQQLRPLSDATHRSSTLVEPLQHTPATFSGESFYTKKDATTGMFTKIADDQPAPEKKKKSLEKNHLHEKSDPAIAQPMRYQSREDAVSLNGSDQQLQDQNKTKPIEVTKTLEFSNHDNNDPQTIEMQMQSTQNQINKPEQTRQSASLTETALHAEWVAKEEKMEGKSSAHGQVDVGRLKYAMLRKNRQSAVRDFELDSDFSTSRSLQQDYQAANESFEKPDLSIFAQVEKSTEPLHQVDESHASKEQLKKQMDLPNEPIEQEELMKRWNEVKMDAADTGEYTDPAQIDEVKQSLVEIQYSLITRFVGNILVALMGILITFFNLKMVFNENPLPLLDVEQNPFLHAIFYGILSILLISFSFDMFKEGILSIGRRKINRMALPAIGMLGMFMFQVLLILFPDALKQDRVFIYFPVFSLCIAIGYIGRLQGIMRIMKNFSIISTMTNPCAVHKIEQQEVAERFTKDVLQESPHFFCNQETPFLSDFLSESFSSDLTDQQSKYLMPFVVLASLVGGGLALRAGLDMFQALTVFTGILTMGTGAGWLVLVNMPLKRVANELNSIKSAVLGYQGVERYGQVNSLLIEANQLFNPEDITLYGIKTFSNMSIDRVILDATSVLNETKSILGTIFLNIISDRKDYLDPVDTVIYEDGMGVSAWIQDRRILIGSRDLMMHHNIDVPSQDYEKRYFKNGGHNLIYLSDSGEMSAVFVLGLNCNNEKRNILVDLYNENIAVIVKTVDPILTEQKLDQVFEMPEGTFTVVPARLHKEALALEHSEVPANGAISNNGTLDGYIYSVIASKKLRKSMRMGWWFYLVSVILAIIIFCASTFIDGLMPQLNPMVLLGYQLLCFVGIVGVQRFYKFVLSS